MSFGKRVVTGYILGFKEESNLQGVKDILDVLDEEPLFDEKRLRFYRWAASYYCSPLGEVLKLIHPAGLNIKDQRYISITDVGMEFLQKGMEDRVRVSDILKFISEKKVVSFKTLAKSLNIKNPYNMIAQLKEQNLITEARQIKGGIKEKKGVFVSVRQGIGDDITARLKKSAPLQAKVVSFLSDKGEVPLSLLRKELGNVDSSVRRLGEKGIVSIWEKEVDRNPFEPADKREISFEPNKEQSDAISLITAAVRKGKFSPFLLHGVTGSGKTFVYLNVIKEAVNGGKRVIILVPEISLTYGLIRYLTGIFPSKVAVVHSGLSEGERYDQWKKIRDGKVDIVIGARSAVFSPLKDIGLIVVDEEHDASYKQEDGVRYNARDLSVMLAKMLDAVVVLGSATPSVETFYNAQHGKITLISLEKRVEGRPMPYVELVDMRNLSSGHESRGHPAQRGHGSWRVPSVRGHGERVKTQDSSISERLKSVLSDAFDKKEQAILFLNRRGFSNFIICRDCGHIFKCINCSVSMTFHKRENAMRCHYCDLSVPVPNLCPKCNGYNMKDIGVGTERLEEDVRRIFVKIRIARMDRDTTQKKRAHESILNAVESGMADVLVGTQMVTKGHDFPNVSVMGIISADTSMNIPDFRSSERTFQLITQAAGRAGRGDVKGRVIVQTFNPEHYCFRSVLNHDYISFFNEEIKIRKEAFYPPFCRLVNMRIEGNSEKKVVHAASVLRKIADKHLKPFKGDIILLGPVSAFLSVLRGKHRWHMLVKGSNVKSLHGFIKTISDEFRQNKITGIELIVDVDPQTTV
ncbi:MAG: primosomal protein N' [Deltaproteobacteria bacterium GWC2_42_11]|nr:MAG: primosomal protein N' [Deltaproteobacteria bacterium GWC2_42_11]